MLEMERPDRLRSGNGDLDITSHASPHVLEDDPRTIQLPRDDGSHLRSKIPSSLPADLASFNGVPDEREEGEAG